MKCISLFSGCGGMDFAARDLGIDVILANDIMRQAGDTYKRYFPETEFIYGDVGDIESFPEADLVMGGYPCQSFSMGGHRDPGRDGRTELYKHFARCLASVNPRFFVAENVSGLKSLGLGRWFREQVGLFATQGRHGYCVSARVLQAESYGVPQRRKRLFLVGVRRDLGLWYWFPPTTHGSPKEVEKYGLRPYVSHGDVIAGLPLWPSGEFYERPGDPEGHWSWYYMSRNRKARWDGPSLTILANLRHTPLHPASCTMRLVWSNLADGSKQKWEFTGEYEHTKGRRERLTLETPRRLSWRECALIQTFPAGFEPTGNVAKKFEQIGNAVPPLLVKTILGPLIDGSALKSRRPEGSLACSAADRMFSQNRSFSEDELEASGMIAYTVADRWLDPNSGRLSFVSTQSHL